jgi:hypothetical protein
MSHMPPLLESEVKQLVDTWYAKLDVHAPVEELLPLLADEGLEMKLPEVTLHGHAEFIQWYEGVIRTFFDEIHTMKELHITLTGGPRETNVEVEGSLMQAQVQLVVNWQAHRWKAPAAKSEWLGFDATQRWVVQRLPNTGKPVVVTYIVDALTPMEGSVPL